MRRHPVGRVAGTVAACYAFAVQALDRHVTVTSVPLACTGLSHEEINQAVDRGHPHGGRAAPQGHRAAAGPSGGRLPFLPRHRGTAAGPAIAGGRAVPAVRRLAAALAALGAWVATVAAGVWLLAGWIARGGLRRRFTRVAGVPRAVLVGLFALALTGLGIWIGFLVAGVAALAWAAVGVVLAVAGLGMATLAGGLPEQRRPGGGPPEQRRPGGGPPEQ